MRFAKLLRLPAALILALGLVLHLTVADACGPLRAIFYALPWPVMALGWLVTAFLWGPKQRRGIACLVLSLACGGWWLKVSYRHPAAPQSGVPSVKVLSWNMAHEKLPSADLQTLLETYKPDIAGLVEVGSRHSDPGALLTTLPAGYTAKKLDNALALVVRGTIRLVDEVSIKDHGISKFASLEAVVDGVTWRVFIVDGASSPVSPREGILARVLKEARGKPHTIVLGDFNTPIESALFNPWQSEFRHAFNDTGHGFRETWPRQLPVLTIDHIWSSQDAAPLQAQKLWLRSSDHAALLSELSRR